MRIKVWLLTMMGMSILAGCSLWQSGVSGGSGQENPETSKTAQAFHFAQRGETNRNILLNQIGFTTEGSKEALLKGEGLAETYEIHDAITDELVFTGKLEAVITNTQEGEGLQLAEFDEIKKQGQYYLLHEDLGYSYPFVVEEEVYEEVEKKLLADLEKESEDTRSVCYQLAGLLLTMDLYSDQIEEPQKVHQLILKKAEWLSKAQDKKTGRVEEAIRREAVGTEFTEAVQVQETVRTESFDAAAEYAGTMAMCANYLQTIDWGLAEQYRRMAEKAFSSIKGDMDQVRFDAAYFALSQLYKKTLKGSYGRELQGYMAVQEKEREGYREYDFTLFGDYAHLSGRQGMNLEWSSRLMNKMLQLADEISLTSDQGSYGISSENAAYGVEKILEDAMVMSLVNYVIPNYEYNSLLEDHLDYLLGKNPYGWCLMNGFGTRNIPYEEGEGIAEGRMALLYLLLQSVK